MIKSSVKVKYVNSCHPDKRDGLLKANLDNLEEGESPFHNNIFTYYENRPILEIENEVDSLNPIQGGGGPYGPPNHVCANSRKFS